jgi:hypothetical protein
MKKINNKLEPIIITDERILQFYNNNKQLNITKINLLYIDLFESILNTAFDNSSMIDKIFLHFNNLNNDIQNIMSSVKHTSDSHKLELSSIKNMYSLNLENIKNEMTNFKSSLSNISSLLINKIYETKESYLNDFKDVLKSSDLQNNNNIYILLDKYNNLLTDKIYSTINDIIPKTQQEYYNKIINHFNNNDTAKLYDNLTKSLTDNISQSENRLNNNLMQLNELSIKNNILQENINDELLKYINKFNNSSLKGNICENKLYNILIEIFPSADIINTSNFTGQGDFKLNRKNKDPILIETKNYSDNVKTTETDKFLRDCTNNKSHGLFLSQTSGIINKDNFQIDFHNNKILIFIHNLNFDKYKLSLAVNIIDILSDKINSFNNNNIHINPDIFKNINDEYQLHLTIKNNMINDLKDFYKKSIDNFNKLYLPEFEKILSKYFANTKKITYLCDICNKNEYDSLKSLARHKNICKKKNNNSTSNTNYSTSNTNYSTEEE